MTVNINEELHEAAAIAARALGMSIKAYIERSIEAKLKNDREAVLQSIEGKIEAQAPAKVA